MYQRFLPSLMDRLMDDAPGASSEGAEQRHLTFNQYRHGFLRDITQVLSYGLQPAPLEIGDESPAASSVLNYGMRNLLGIADVIENPRLVEENIKQAIIRFEPRVNPETLQIHILTGDDSNDSRMRNLEIEIEAELWSKPYSEFVYILTTVDLHNATVNVKEWRNV